MDTITTAPRTDDRIDEVGALFEVLLDRPADAPTACPGWTAHELVAHLAAGAAEESALIDAHLRGEPARTTRGFAEREAPYRALPHDELLATLVEEGARLTARITDLRAQGDDVAVTFTGRPMTADGFAMHSRSECALHRWDLVGSDVVSAELLARPELTQHAVRVLSEMTTLPEAFARRVARLAGVARAPVVLRSPRVDDVVLSVDRVDVKVGMEAPGPGPATVELPAADRLLLLWGRRPPETDPSIDRAVLRAFTGS
jgi:uncharacterized protein (TIGR03083 family)